MTTARAQLILVSSDRLLPLLFDSQYKGFERRGRVRAVRQDTLAGVYNAQHFTCYRTKLVFSVLGFVRFVQAYSLHTIVSLGIFWAVANQLCRSTEQGRLFAMNRDRM